MVPVLVPPDCVNIQQEVGVDGELLPLQERLKPLQIPDGLVDLTQFTFPVEFAVTCNGQDAVSPGSLLAGDFVEVTGIYANDAGDPDDINGVCTQQPCYDIFRGAIKADPVNFRVADAAPSTNVEIDIKPGTFPNDLNTTKKGTTPVAIFGEASFLNSIQVSSLRLGGTVLVSGATVNKSNGVQTIGGRLALMVHFNTPTRDQLGFPPTGLGTTLAIVTGQLNNGDGDKFTGVDSLQIVK